MELSDVSAARDDDQPELTVLMPCLNEAETIGRCVAKAQQAIARHGLHAEIVVADNGSSDGSQSIAEALGARVVAVAERGYGAALSGGVRGSRGRFIVMADSDDSYDFSALFPFLEKLRSGNDLVMGNRFRGGIMPGAMPWSHRWIGNPVLSFIGRLFFHCPARDFHCGMRGFRRDAYERMELRTTGMEFASEMVIKATLKGMRVTEIPTVLSKDGRSHPPHLRSWRDGWRHLRFMLLFSPRWLFLYPGLFLLLSGLALFLWLLPGPRRVGSAVLDIHTLLVAGVAQLAGFQLVIFAVFTKIFAIAEGLHPPHTRLRALASWINLEVGLVVGVGMTLAGVVVLALATLGWGAAGFGDLAPEKTMRQVIPAVVLILLGIETVFASFFVSILTLLKGRP